MTADRTSLRASHGAVPDLGLDRLPTVALACDAAGCIVAVNARWCSALGHQSDASVGRELTTFLVGTSVADFTLWLAAPEDGVSLTLRVRSAQGGACDFIAVLSGPGPDGAPGVIVLTETAALSDEAERLRSDNERLSAIIESADCATWEWNIDSGQVRVSDRWWTIVGEKAALPQADGTETWLGQYHPADRVMVGCQMERHLSGKAALFDVEARARHANGRWIWVRDVGRVRTRTKAGEPEWIAGLRRDISSRKRWEARLRRSEELLSRAGMLAGLGSWEVDLRSGEVYWSDETCRIHGTPPGHRPTLEEGIKYYAPEARPIVEAAVEAGMTNGTPWDFELPLIRADGKRVWVRAVGEVTLEDGKPVRLNGAFQDISNRKENERRLAEAAEEAQRARDRLNTLADNVPGALFEHREAASGEVDLPYFSARLPDLLGVPREVIEADGAAAAANIDPGDLGPLGEEIRRTRDTLSPLDFRYRLNHPEKGQRWMHLSSIPFRQPDGAVIWHGSVFDVTEQELASRQLSEALEELRITHERLNTVAEHVPGALFEYRREADGRTWFPYFTHEFTKLLGVSEEALRDDGATVFHNIPQQETEEILAKLERSIPDMARVEFRHRVVVAGEETRWLNVWAAPFAHPDGSIAWFGKSVDVTERLAMEARAEEASAEVSRAHSRLNSIADIAPVGLFEFRRLPGGGHDFPYTSARFNDLLGFSRAEIERLRGDILARIDEADRSPFLASLDESAQTLSQWSRRFRFHHPQRGLMWLSGAAVPRLEGDGTIVWTGALHDVTGDVEREAELKQAHRLAEKMRAENERLAFHDGLTGLPNRRYFDKVLRQRVQGAYLGVGPRDCALVQIDLDHFKHVNDTLGHEAGDQVLLRVGDVLRECLREGDFAARLGGDEFSVILAASTPRSVAKEIVENLRSRLSEPFQYRGCPCRISASFGIVHAPDVTLLEEELQLFADAALYRAKESGRNRLEFHAAELTSALRDDRHLAAELQEALEQGQFIPYFQPQVSALDGRLEGVETLVRWNHPKRGILAPGAFMRMAEHLRIVPEIDRTMMEEACKSMRRWRQQGLVIPKISFNVSAGRMHDPSILDAVAEMNQCETQLALELVESIRIEEEGSIFRKHLDLLREAGVDIEIDDFGSGHTSIIGLMQVEPSALKIDRRIVAPVADNFRASDLVRSIVQMAQTLGVATIAEGVETQEQADTLRALGCNVLQGFLFSPPLSEDDLAAFALGHEKRLATDATDAGAPRVAKGRHGAGYDPYRH
ncbi:diguanylate cyclase/phosphodiesterase (GGDEF & EAL domains) with PAS/PAC sensor(s) [Rhodovulum sp. P5]|uniref:EAL domain-containing protein n=1 Tax=Rhodovulum sp. P5 TaxID=1564506 RepID=UPI0009C2422E|nr:EAL domain-containing protein [Rhodovulum sp. P5]ARE39081.1 diguanylate cyclase/phosphodiesterase (GGDEF & EAL domains) with PAS/PAC sensor(s) [Rhodovulum sp. P5]